MAGHVTKVMDEMVAIMVKQAGARHASTRARVPAGEADAKCARSGIVELVDPLEPDAGRGRLGAPAPVTLIDLGGGRMNWRHGMPLVTLHVSRSRSIELWWWSWLYLTSVSTVTSKGPCIRTSGGCVVGVRQARC